MSKKIKYSILESCKNNFSTYDCRAAHPLSNEPNHASLRENVTEELAFNFTPKIYVIYETSSFLCNKSKISLKQNVFLF